MPTEPPGEEAATAADRSEQSQRSEQSERSAERSEQSQRSAERSEQSGDQHGERRAAPGAAPKGKAASGAKPAKTAGAPSFGALLGKRWRGWLRAVHRDIGYLAVGLTFIYALSGLAINHLQDWDPNFHSFSRERSIAPIGAEVPDEEAFARVRAALDLPAPRDTYRAGDELHLSYDGREVVVYGDSGQVTDQGQKPRFFFRVANWLHYNRGKKAWTYIADAYAVLLLYLAVSGMFMIKGKLGLKWRGTLLVGLGAAVPIAYVVLSGGPNANAKKTADASDVSDGSEPGKQGDDVAPAEERMQPRPPRGATPKADGTDAATKADGDDGANGADAADAAGERMQPRQVPGEK